jgi:fatty acid desaturase
MSTAAAGVTRPGVLAHSRRDAVLVGLAAAWGAVLLAFPSAWAVGLGLWWCSNTVAHCFLHRPFFRWRPLNLLFALYLTLLVGVPQSVWRSRHLAHHAGRPWRFHLGGQTLVEVALVLGLWGALLARRPAFFLTAYAPGYLLGLGLCWLHGHYEHARGTVSHHGRLYNLLFFNDGYHVEHHAHPGLHWTLLPHVESAGTPTSRWPAVLRWLDALSLEGLERLVLRWPWLQRRVVAAHANAFRALLPPLPEAPRVAIVGGGLFPRTLLVLRRLLPGARFLLIDRSADNLALAAAFLADDVEVVHAAYEPARLEGTDVAVFPLAFVGDREAIYRRPPAPVVFVHDWAWRRRGEGTVVSPWLVKRLNRVRR